MSFLFTERPFSGSTFRPRPEIFLDQETKTLIVATPWGSRESARRVIERMKDYLSIAREDAEATSPFERLSCLSTHANRLRIATLLANEALYREENKNEYRSGVEVFAGILEDDEFVWLQNGNPQILLSRPGRKPLPLGSQIDLSFDLSEGSELLPGLPSQMLGLDSSLNVSLNSFRARPGDKVALISHSHLPEAVYGLQDSQLTVESMSRLIATACPDHAFWVGVLELGMAGTAKAAS